MNKHKEKDFYKNKNPKKEATKNAREEIIHDKYFCTIYWKCSIQKYNSKTFISDYGDMSHMITTEENMINLYNAETQVTVGDIGTLNRIKFGY